MGDNDLHLNDGQEQGMIHLPNCRLVIKYENKKRTEAESEVEVSTDGVTDRKVSPPPKTSMPDTFPPEKIPIKEISPLPKKGISDFTYSPPPKYVGNLADCLHSVPDIDQKNGRKVFMQFVFDDVIINSVEKKDLQLVSILRDYALQAYNLNLIEDLAMEARQGIHDLKMKSRVNDIINKNKEHRKRNPPLDI